ncbi:hypothetical protein GGX14DRAFT_457460 [Mycena pura]|uniref:Uncharacterized protein n=1 Tax=Mycena pura TaxID=153505 RepID=A0AAD6YCU4_9AGAR|nr:hypothetical protein GGX14DRAFT_457460 [Mycena pura]
MSVPTKHCTAFGIHPVPANMSKKDFEAKCEALVESFLALPVAHRNLLKFDIIFQNDHMSDFFKSLGLPEPQPVVCLRCEYETEANWAECLRDPEYVKAMDAGKSWGFHDGSCIFSADVVSKRERDIPRDRNVAIGILKVPAHISPMEFSKKTEALIDAVFDLRKPNCSVTTYVQNMNAEEHLQAAGYPPSQPSIVAVTDWPTWDELTQIYDEPEARNILQAAMKDFAFHVDSVFFSGDVVVKLQKA